MTTFIIIYLVLGLLVSLAVWYDTKDMPHGNKLQTYAMCILLGPILAVAVGIGVIYTKICMYFVK